MGLRGAATILRAGNKLDARRGVTLVEVAVATMVLGIGIVGLLMAMGRILDGAVVAVTTAQAMGVAEGALGEMELLALAPRPVGPAEGHDESDRFHWAVVVTPDPDSPQKPLATWSATVLWKARQRERQERAIRLSRIVWVPAL